MTVTTDALVPLESGDRLTRQQFHERYSARPDIKKAELVGGVVYVASPLRHRWHGRPHLLIGTWMGTYIARTPGVDGSDNATVYLTEHSEVQPDLCLFRLGGGLREQDQGYLEGTPELVIEIVASSAAYDLHDKLEAYQRAGVQDYLVWQTLERRFDWFELHEGRYRPVTPDEQGMIESRVFPGLRLNVAALLAGDGAAVHAALDRPA